MAWAAFVPMQSGQWITGAFNRADRCGAITAVEYAGSRPFGRPKWDNNTGLPWFSRTAFMVGIAWRRRVISVGVLPCIGTFKSTRIRAVFPVRSWSFSVVRVWWA